MGVFDAFDDLFSKKEEKSVESKVEPDTSVEEDSQVTSDAPSTDLGTIVVKSGPFCDYWCNKTGIPVLPLVFSKYDYKLNSNDKRFFKDKLSHFSKNRDAITSLPVQAYFYIFCIYENYVGQGKKILEFFTGEDGSLRYIESYNEKDFSEKDEHKNTIDIKSIEEGSVEDYENIVQPVLCSKVEHSTLKSKYITLGATDITWFMISHAKISKSVLEKYYYNDDLRNKRMQKFITTDLDNNINTLKMSEISPEISYINSFSQRKQLSQSEIINEKIIISDREFNEESNGSLKSANMLYSSMKKVIKEEVDYLEEELSSVYDGEEGEIEKKLDKKDIAVYKKSEPMKVALPDPVGDVLAAAEKRNYLLKKLDDAQKDKSKIREQVNAIIIDNIKSSIENNTRERIGYKKDVKFSASTSVQIIEGNNRIRFDQNKSIYKYINESKFKEVLESAKKDRKIKQELAKARQEFVKAINHPDFAYIMREDFIEGDLLCDLGYAKIIADAIQGLGIDESNLGIPDAIWADYQPEQAEGMTAREEFEQTMLPCLSEEKPLEDNWLIKALIGLNTEDHQKMQDAPTYENLARASDAIGTATSWLNTFKTIEQQKVIDANIAKKMQQLNELASQKSRIILTMSHNMSHIKENNRILSRVDLWTQASVKQSTGLQLARRVLKYAPDRITNKLGSFLKGRIDKAKPYKTIIPAAIDEAAGKPASSSAPFAVEYIHRQHAYQQALDIYNKAAAGDKNAYMVVMMYTDKKTADDASSLNQSIIDDEADLRRYTDSHSGAYRQLERSSAGKAALISAGIAVFQLRSVWMGKSSLSAMANRGDLIAREFLTSYTSTTLALTGAALDVAAAGMQIRGASASTLARIGLSVGVIGAVGAGFEVYSLELTQQRMKESGSTTSYDAITIAQGAAVTAGIAGLGYGTLAFAGIGAFALPWLGAIIAVAWGVSLIAQWVAFSYDKGNILPIHYWLDAGVFGDKKMCNDDYPNNPFKIQAMSSLEQDIHAYSLALTEMQVNPKFTTNTTDFRQILSGQIEITLSQWNDDSELVVEFIAIGDQELGLDRKSFKIEMLKRQNKAIKTQKGLEVVLDIPTTSHFQAQYLGSYKEGTRNPNKVQRMQEARERAQANAGGEVNKLRAVVKYALNPSANPHYQLRTTVTS